MTTTLLRPPADPPVDPPLAPSLRTRYGFAAGAVVAAWTGVLWASQHIGASGTVRDVALFVHLASLVAGMGAVLTVDWAGLHWLRGRRSLADVLQLTADAHLLIWLGLAGLAVSGAFLSPDLTAGRTLVKLGAVLLVALNGVQAHALQQQLVASAEPTRGLLLRIAISAATSQAGWWTAVVVGYLNSRAA